MGCSYLWREIVGCAAQRPRRRRTGFCEAKVCDFYVPVAVEKDVFGLEVAVDDVLLVQVVESESDLSGVEFCHRLGEALKWCQGWRRLS